MRSESRQLRDRVGPNSELDMNESPRAHRVRYNMRGTTSRKSTRMLRSSFEVIGQPLEKEMHHMPLAKHVLLFVFR